MSGSAAILPFRTLEQVQEELRATGEANTQRVRSEATPRVPSQPKPERQSLKDHKYAEAARAQKGLARYGLTRVAFADLLLQQNGKCAICYQPYHPKRKLHVDHCHATGKVRGLLCGGCNIGLGHFCDDTSRMERAIGYLRAFYG